MNAKIAKGSKRGDWYAEVAEGAEDAEKRGGRGVEIGALLRRAARRRLGCLWVGVLGAALGSGWLHDGLLRPLGRRRAQKMGKEGTRHRRWGRRAPGVVERSGNEI